MNLTEHEWSNLVKNMPAILDVLKQLEGGKKSGNVGRRQKMKVFTWRWLTADTKEVAATSPHCYLTRRLALKTCHESEPEQTQFDGPGTQPSPYVHEIITQEMQQPTPTEWLKLVYEFLMMKSIQAITEQHCPGCDMDSLSQVIILITHKCFIKFWGWYF